MRTRKVLIQFILFFIVGLLPPLQVVGQSSLPEAVVDGQLVEDNDESLSLDVFFYVAD